MKLSVIIPAFNEEKLLGETLRRIQSALAAVTGRGWAAELIVCDNNSTDRTAEIAREQGAAVVFEAQNQISRARNRGAAAATGDWLLFIDADSHPDAALFEELIGVMETGRCLGGGCTVKLDGAYFLAGLITKGWNLLSRVRRWAAGSFVFCEAAAFRKLGGFSTNLYASEEIEFSERLKRMARGSGKQVRILHRHPLVTSARKLHLYSPWEYFRFMAKTVVLLGKPLRCRADCQPWYDGRR